MATEPSGPLLITGFEPFGGEAENPSQEVVRALTEDSRWETRILPVAYEAADRSLEAVLAELAPVGLLMLGLHGDPTDGGLRLEHFAQNIDDADLADTAGLRRFGCRIESDGPSAYESGLPLDAFAARLEILEVPYRSSRDAGGFLCNHVFYRARSLCPDRPSGFVHLPSTRKLPLTRQVAAVSACAETLLSDTQGELRVQFAHGLEGSPRGSKARRLADHFVCATPAMNTRDFESCVAHHRAVIERFRPDILVGSSFGGAVVAALVERGFWQGPSLLLAQAAQRMLPGLELPADASVALVHGRRDELIPLEESEALAGDHFPLLVVDDDHALHASTEAGEIEGWIRRVAAGLDPRG